MFMTPAYILGSFGNLRKNRQYNVADKNISSKNFGSESKTNSKVQV